MSAQFRHIMRPSAYCANITVTERNIGTPVTRAEWNVHTDFGFSALPSF